MSEPILTTPSYQLAPTPTKRRITLAIGVLALLVIAAIGYYFRNQIITFFTPLQLPNAVFVLSAGTLPAGVTLIDDGEARLLMVPETGEFLKVIDAAFVGTSTAYYLIADPLYSYSNLYRQDLSSPTHGLVQLTDSMTLKMHLSVALQGDLLAYDVVRDTAPASVELYSISADSEMTMGSGTRPVLSPDGSQVVYEREGMLVLMDLTSNIEYPLLASTILSPHAIDFSSRSIAIYSAEKKSIEQYSFKALEPATLLSSKKVSFVPAALAYANGVLFYMSPISKDDREVTIGSLLAVRSLTIRLPEGNRLADLTQYSLTIVPK